MASEELEGLLFHGESIVWSGRPARGLRFFVSDIITLPSLLIFCGLFGFFQYNIASVDLPPLFRIVSVLPGVAILLILIWRFVLDAMLRANTIYAVTDRRALIVRSGLASVVHTVILDRDLNIIVSSHFDGRSSFRFQGEDPIFQRRPALPPLVPSLDPVPQFLAIENGDRVFAMIEAAITVNDGPARPSGHRSRFG